MVRRAPKRKPRREYPSEEEWEARGEVFGQGMEGFFRGLKKHFKNKPSSSNFKHIYIHKSSSHDAVYGLGFIGALIYYLSTAPNLWIGFIGILKAFVWPAILIFEILKFLGL